MDGAHPADRTLALCHSVGLVETSQACPPEWHPRGSESTQKHHGADSRDLRVGAVVRAMTLLD